MPRTRSLASTRLRRGVALIAALVVVLNAGPTIAVDTTVEPARTAEAWTLVRSNPVVHAEATRFPGDGFGSERLEQAGELPKPAKVAPRTVPEKLAPARVHVARLVTAKAVKHPTLLASR
jgi:hypothetical protein